jgi:8-oxo-dGTP diphosphatase
MTFEDYARPSVAVDIIVLTVANDTLQVLLIRRRHPPHRGYWAFPGGFVDIDEGLEVAALRELEEEAGVQDVHLEQLHTFGDPRRDPRGRVISVAYLALVRDASIRPRAGDDASDVGWWPAHDPPPLAFDHDRILAAALQRVSERLLCDPARLPLLPEEFDLEELRRRAHAILGEPVATSAFVDDLLAAGLVESFGAGTPGDASAPVTRYRFRSVASRRALSGLRAP